MKHELRKIANEAGQYTMPSFTDSQLLVIRLFLESQKKEWISVEDRLPDSYTEAPMVLCAIEKMTMRGHFMYDLFWFSDDGKWSNSKTKDYENNANLCFITHWMPLPEPPINQDK